MRAGTFFIIIIYYILLLKKIYSSINNFKLKTLNSLKRPTEIQAANASVEAQKKSCP